MFVLMACRKDDPVPRHETVTLFTDSIVFTDAEYITSSDSVITYGTLNLEEFKLAPVSSTVIFGEDSPVSVRYLGGWRNPIEYYPNIPISYDPCGNCNIVYDTVYEARPVYLSYAILEIIQDGETRVDTAILDKESRMKLFQESSALYDDRYTVIGMDISAYLNATLDHFKSWEQTTTGYYFELQFNQTYYSVKLSGENKNIYLVDILPYWQSPLTTADLVFYTNN